MSKSELKEEKKKRKRQGDEVEDALKKVKKSKKSKDAMTEEGAVVPDKKNKGKKTEKVNIAKEDGAASNAIATETKEKRERKKSKKSKDFRDEYQPKLSPAEDARVDAPVANGAAEDNALAQDFIRFDDAPMPDAFADQTSAVISLSKQKKPKKDKQSKKGKRDKKDKKDKKSKQPKGKDEDENEALQQPRPPVVDAIEPVDSENIATAEDQTNNTSPVMANGGTSEAKKDKKKLKKPKEVKKVKNAQKAAAENDDAAAEANGAIASEEHRADDNAQETAEAQEETLGDKKDRFIVFIGNLPYSATKEQIEKHFAKVQPFQLRMRTYKGGKFMGTAFMEFDRFDKMQTALKKYHHSIFPDGTKEGSGRKINVELSAGGGGNNPVRLDKIKAKNAKLENERQRAREKRDEVESKQKERKEKKEKETKQKQGSKKDKAAAAGEAEAKEDAPSDEHAGMHPARLAMMQQGLPKWQGHTRQRY